MRLSKILSPPKPQRAWYNFFGPECKPRFQSCAVKSDCCSDLCVIGACISPRLILIFNSPTDFAALHLSLAQLFRALAEQLRSICLSDNSGSLLDCLEGK